LLTFVLRKRDKKRYFWLGTSDASVRGMSTQHDSALLDLGTPDQRRFEALEPLLLEEERSLWKCSAEAAAAFFDGPSAALVMLSSRRQHVLLGQVGLDPEFETTRAVAAEISPASVALVHESTVYLDPRNARQWGLSCWLRASRSRALVIAPLWMEDLLVGALVLGVPGNAAPRAWRMEGLEKLAREISALLVHTRDERERERNSGLTVVDPGAARLALRGALRRIEQTMLQLALASSKLWRGLALHEEDLPSSSAAVSRLYQDALGSQENLARRLKMLIDWSSPAGSDRARRRVLELAQGLLGLRALLLLGQAIGTGRLSQEQGTQALKMLGNQGPDGVRMVQIVRELQEWLEEVPASVRPWACNGG
jgi:hypothetical protein